MLSPYASPKQLIALQLKQMDAPMSYSARRPTGNSSAIVVGAKRDEDDHEADEELTMDSGKSIQNMI